MRHPSSERREDGARAHDLIEPVTFRPPSAWRNLAWPRVPWLALSVLATVAATVLIVGYLLFARSVQIGSEPAGARVEIAEWLSPRLGEHWLLLPGRHRVRAEAPGYRPYTDSIEVTRDSLQAYRIALTPLPGRLRFRLAPVAEATVAIDGQPAGKAPGLIEEVAAGARDIEVTAPRYLPFTTSFTVHGKRELQELTVTLLPAWAEFAIASKPAGAQVSVDGEPLGETPLRGELIHGEREITLTRHGYKPWRRRVEVVAGRAVNIPDATLVQADGVLEVVSNPPGAAVTVDGRFRGEAPVKVPVAPGVEHRVVIMKAGYAPAALPARAAADATETVAVQLEPELATIELISVPEDAELLIDGRPAGTATQRLSLPTHDHEITVRKSGYATYRTIVTPRKGVEKRMKITLKTAAEMAREQAASPPPPVTRTPPPSATAPGAATPPAPPPNVPEHQFTAEAAAQSALVASVFGPPAAGGEQAPAPLALEVDGIVRSHVGQELKLFQGGEFVAANRQRVRLARPFYFALREVSNVEFRRFMSSHVSRGADGQDLNADTLPAVGVTWEAAAQYCNWLSRRESLPPFYQIKYGRVLGINPDAVGYRLPTEAEWEWAAGTTAKGKRLEYPWGSEFPPPARTGNFADRSAREAVPRVIAGYDDGFATAAPIGSFAPNARGLYDLAGNVAEWTHDYYAGGGITGTDSLGPGSGEKHAVRGSSWADADGARLQLAHREGASGARPDLGFRIARYAQ